MRIRTQYYLNSHLQTNLISSNYALTPHITIKKRAFKLSSHIIYEFINYELR